MIRFILIPTSAILFLAACSGEPDCDPMRAFEQARNEQRAESACPGRDYDDARQLGQTLGEMERERDALAARGEDLDVGERMRLRVLQREIPELETLARIQGYLGPVKLDLPDRSEDRAD